MAIYLGTWKDGDGVDFDPAAFSLSENPRLVATNIVGGDPCTPNCHGTYEYTGQHDGLPYFKHQTAEFYWYFAATPATWCICDTLNNDPDDYWVAADQAWGGYENEGAYNGDPDVTVGVPCTLKITGTLNPDATGTYTHAGTFEDNPYWRDETLTYFLFSNGSDWFIDTELDRSPDADFWETEPSPWDPVWQPDGAYTGNPASDPTTPLISVAYGTCRLRIHARPHGSGQRPDYYPAGPHFVKRWYPISPWQWMARRTFGTIMKDYFTFPPFPPVIVTGVLNPDVTGTYGGQGFHSGKAYWYNAATLYFIWWDVPRQDWLMALTYPIDPQNGQPYWFRTDPSPYGAYAPWQGAVGVAQIGLPP